MFSRRSYRFVISTEISVYCEWQNFLFSGKMNHLMVCLRVLGNCTYNSTSTLRNIQEYAKKAQQIIPLHNNAKLF